jgi:hypothetical protein
MNTFKEIRALLIAESIKLRRTPVVWMSLGAPAFAVTVAFIASLTNGNRFYQAGISPWTDFSAHILVGWALFVFPIYVCLQTALYSSLEHNSNGWSYLATLPVGKHKLLFSKYCCAVLLVAISQVLLVCLTWAAGWILAVLRPSYGFQDYPMTSMPAKACMWVFLSGLTIVGIQMMLSMLYRSFVVPTGTGLLFIFGGVIARSLAISIYWPFLWPILLLNNTADTAQWRLSFGVAGVLGFVSISILGILLIVRRGSLNRHGL